MNATIKLQVTDALTLALPGYHFELQQMRTDPTFIGVALYNISFADVPEVKRAIWQVEDTLFPNNEFALIPRFRG